MELGQNVRRASTRPMAWAATVLMTVLVAVICWYAFPRGSDSASSPVTRPAAAQPPLLDRNAERQPTRNGGPGGQIGDTP